MLSLAISTRVLGDLILRGQASEEQVAKYHAQVVRLGLPAMGDVSHPWGLEADVKVGNPAAFKSRVPHSLPVVRVFSDRFKREFYIKYKDVYG